jgi:hypothetical protein
MGMFVRVEFRTKSKLNEETMHIPDKIKTQVNETLDSILATFADGSIVETLTRVAVDCLASNKPSRNWSFVNQMLMRSQGTNDARGYKQWLSVGRHVKRGTHADVCIRVPSFRTVRDTDNKIVDLADGTPRKRLVGFSWIKLHRFENTEGSPLPELVPSKLPVLYDVAERLGVRVEYIESDTRFYGTYSPDAKTIRLCTHVEHIFFHELAHAAHDVLERRAGRALRKCQDPKQETIADLSACVLSRIYGLVDDRKNTFDYIRGYVGNDVHSACLSVVKTVGDIVSHILVLTDNGTGA